jgi:hypothetical protein
MLRSSHRSDLRFAEGYPKRLVGSWMNNVRRTEQEIRYRD